MSPDSTFVATLAELRRAVLPGGAETTRDSAGRAAVRDSILRKYHVTPLALEDIARGLSRDPNHAAEILRAIDRKVLLDLSHDVYSQLTAMGGAKAPSGASVSTQ